MKKPIFILGILILTILSLFVVRTVVLNRISTSGLALGDMQSQIASLQTQNTILREKIFADSSLTHISSEAAKKGFVEGSSSFAVAKNLPLARR